MHQLAKAGNKSAKIIRDLQQHLSLVVSAVLAYNTLLNAAIASVLASLSFDLFGDNSTIAAVVSSVVTGAIVLVFAEMLPKTLAIQDTIRFLMFAAPGIRFFYNLFLPLNKALSFFVTFIMRVFGL
ncbi:MAG: CNNM domain-containing protein, partial [bacterium]